MNFGTISYKGQGNNSPAVNCHLTRRARLGYHHSFLTYNTITFGYRFKIATEFYAYSRKLRYKQEVDPQKLLPFLLESMKTKPKTKITKLHRLNSESSMCYFQKEKIISFASK